MTNMVCAQGKIEDIFLNPGEFYFGRGRIRLRTTLGSCIAITLWHPLQRSGGMCHYVLPNRRASRGESFDGRYAEEAMQFFLREIRACGLTAAHYEANIIGGGDMINTGGQRRPSIGLNNALTGVRLLHGHGIQIKLAHVCNRGYRKVIFDIWNGNVRLKYHSPDGAASQSVGEPVLYSEEERLAVINNRIQLIATTYNGERE